MSDAAFETDKLVNTSDFDSSWHDAPRGWGHSVHKLSPYVGGFPPALAHYFIKRYTDPGDVVLDPFCGGGTTPVEAGLLGRTVLANDAFSYAHVLTKAKCNVQPRDRFEEYVESLVDQARAIPDDDLELDNEDIEVFYSESTLRDILGLRRLLDGSNGDMATLVKALVCGILHGPSSMFLSVQTKDTYSGSADYVREYIEENDLEKPDRDVQSCLFEKYDRTVQDGIPEIDSTVTRGDTRSLPFEDEATDFILTSPPYMHTLDYTWNNWIRLWWLGEDRDSERDGMDITADVSKYRGFIGDCLFEMYRTLAPDSRAVIVVGDVKRHRASGTHIINTANIVAEEAEKTAGFEVENVILDEYDADKRSYVTFNEMKYDLDDSDDSAELLDRCIVLSKGSPEPRPEITVDWSQSQPE